MCTLMYRTEIIWTSTNNNSRYCKVNKPQTFFLLQQQNSNHPSMVSWIMMSGTQPALKIEVFMHTLEYSKHFAKPHHVWYWIPVNMFSYCGCKIQIPSFSRWFMPLFNIIYRVSRCFNHPKLVVFFSVTKNRLRSDTKYPAVFMCKHWNHSNETGFLQFYNFIPLFGYRTFFWLIGRWHLFDG